MALDTMALLKQRTAETHQRVERLADLLDPALTTSRLRAVLARFLGVWSPTESALDAWAASDPELAGRLDLPRRRRSPLLRADLAALGADPDAVANGRCALDGPVSAAAVLGWLYVAEGSTLGGAVLARRLAPLLECSGVELLSMTPYAEGPGPMWVRLRGVITEWVAGDEARALEVVGRAQAAFDTLADWLQPLATEHAA